MTSKQVKNENIIYNIVKNTSWLFISDIVSKVLTFILTIAIARYLGVEDFGIYSFVFAFVALFSFIPDFGLSTLANREIAYDKSQLNKYLENILILKLLISLGTIAIIAVTIHYIGKDYNVTILVYLVAIFTFLDSYVLFFKSVFRAFEKMEYEGISKIIRSLSLLFLGLLVILTDKGLKGIIFSYILASTIEFSVSFFLIRKKFTNFNIRLDVTFCKNALKSSSFFVLSAVLMTLYFKIDITMLSILTNDQAVGLYSSSYYVVTLMNIIPSVFLPSVFPIFSKHHENSDYIGKLYSKSLSYLFFVSVFVTLTLITFSKNIMSVLYGEEFLSAVSSFNILVLAGGIIIFDRIGIDLLNAVKKQKLNTITMAACALINVLLNLILIPVYREVGAALATLLSELVLLTLTLYFTKKYINFKYIYLTLKDLISIHALVKRLYKSR